MTQDNSVDRDPDLEKIVEGLARQEAARRKKILATAVVLTLVGGLSLASAIFWRDQIVGPAVDVAAGEEQVLEQTNDPQCRAFIADITAEGVAYKNIMAAIQTGMLGDNADETRRLVGEIEALRKRLADARAKSADANLRYPQSREELDKWFKHIDGELNLMVRLGGEKLEPPAESAFKRPLKDLLDTAVLAGDDAFENFRVWHTASLHPCGAADAGEEGWTP